MTNSIFSEDWQRTILLCTQMHIQVQMHILFMHENPYSTHFGLVRSKDEDTKQDGPSNGT